MADIPCPECGERTVKWRYKPRDEPLGDTLALECKACGASKYWNGTGEEPQ